MSVNNRDIGCLTVDDFKLWSTRALKVFLSLRGKPTTGSFDTLAASNKLQDNAKVQQTVRDTTNKTKVSLQQHAAQIKETLCRMVDLSVEATFANVDDISRKDIEYLESNNETLSKDVEKLNALIVEAKALSETSKGAVGENMLQTLTEAGKSLPEFPVVSLSFSPKVDETVLSTMCEKSRDVLRLGMTGNVQIVECLERPGSIIVKWDEQQVSDSESVTTDASILTEYMLQMCEENSEDGEVPIFRTIYEGDDMQYTMNFAEPGRIFLFRVCQYFSGGTGSGMFGPWSMIRRASTSLDPHVWRSEDCVTESGLQLYQLSNKGRTATKVFPESSRILRSRTASYSIGETITFWIEETGESSVNDGIGFISVDQQSLKHLKAVENAAILNPKGSIFVNGVQMVTKLPVLKKNSIAVFHVTKEKSGKLRVSISIDEKEVTFDWTVPSIISDTNQLFFACGFEHTGWQLSVG